ncbi:hypothetical protein TNIN_403421 [Trichonephila inaurata madagascariensis]|uniref:Uncharacterized protein n=1 Tax=Trichonephila inaurata madagascariensis TaxID=2747483 RepID=A0A8X7CQ54_9ARAC|nr:hypothetical protein TNIN_403421 [Trichonephila inaurata madagascariensis]
MYRQNLSCSFEGQQGKEELRVVLGTREGQDNIFTMPPAYGTCETIPSNMRDFSRSSGIDQSTPLIRVRRAELISLNDEKRNLLKCKLTVEIELFIPVIFLYR